MEKEKKDEIKEFNIQWMKSRHFFIFSTKMTKNILVTQFKDGMFYFYCQKRILHNFKSFILSTVGVFQNSPPFKIQ